MEATQANGKEREIARIIEHKRWEVFKLDVLNEKATSERIKTFKEDILLGRHNSDPEAFMEELISFFQLARANGRSRAIKELSNIINLLAGEESVRIKKSLISKMEGISKILMEEGYGEDVVWITWKFALDKKEVRITLAKNIEGIIKIAVKAGYGRKILPIVDKLARDEKEVRIALSSQIRDIIMAFGKEFFHEMLNIVEILVMHEDRKKYIEASITDCGKELIETIGKENYQFLLLRVKHRSLEKVEDIIRALEGCV